MTNLAQLEAYTRELSTAIKRLATHCQNAKVAVDSMRGGPPQLIPPGAPEEAHRARESALASITKLQIMLAGPTDFLQQMASQVYIRFRPTTPLPPKEILRARPLSWLIAL